MCKWFRWHLASYHTVIGLYSSTQLALLCMFVGYFNWQAGWPAYVQQKCLIKYNTI